MATQTIKEEAYNRLKKLKNGNSFSDVIIDLAEKNEVDLIESFGTISDSEAEKTQENIKEFRERLTKMQTKLYGIDSNFIINFLQADEIAKNFYQKISSDKIIIISTVLMENSQRSRKNWIFPRTGKQKFRKRWGRGSSENNWTP